MTNFTNLLNPVPPSPVQNKAPGQSARIIGIVMAVVAMIAMGWLALEYRKETDKILDFPGTMVPENMFINIFNFTGGSALIVTLFGGALIVLILGIYRIIANKKSKVLPFVAFFLVFGLCIVESLQVNEMRKDVVEELLVVQHDWAEKRYGIEYDDITVRTWEGRKGKTHHAQEHVMRDGEIIASVCHQDDYNILLCQPGTMDELPVYLYDDSY